jgi:2'-5' RNA ligase
MNEQLSLFEAPRSGGVSYNLVLAIFPDDHTTQQVSNLGNSLRKRHGMYGRIRPTSHLHVSLPLPRNLRDVPKTVVENVGRVCKAVTMIAHPFEIKFDRVMSFRGGSGNHPVVLLNADHGSDGIMGLHGLLLAEFVKLGSATYPTPKIVPHLTVLYDKQELAPRPVEPVCWAVKEIVLVLSEVGAAKYHRLGCWRLGE